MLALTLTFLAAVAVAAVRERTAQPKDNYRVAVERSLPEEPEEESGLLDINTATAEELEELMGIGPVLAQAIVDYRTEHGPFSSVEELLEVSGIGETKLESIRGSVTTGEGGEE